MDCPRSAPPRSEATDDVVADVFARSCPSRRTMETIGSKWGILAMIALRDGAYRFNALRRRVDGVSEKMLAQTLQSLERDGLVNREVQGIIPPRVEYRLTPLGQDVAAKLHDLVEAISAAMPQIFAAQAHYDQATNAGE